jgi:hypothetical protein
VFKWLENHPILHSVIDHLDNVRGDHYKEIQRLLDTKISGGRYYNISVHKKPRSENEPEFVGYSPKTDAEHASACLQILRASITKPDLEFYCLLAIYFTQENYNIIKSVGVKGGTGEAFEVIQESVTRDLYEYLDEQLDGFNAVNGLLIKYKQNVEWFQQEKVRGIAENGYEGMNGEKALALHLQQYVFNQGVEFSVEPTSASGEVDLLLRDANGQYTIIDAKYVKSKSSITRKIVEGFNQVARYCDDYNQPQGFLAVFVNDDISIRVDLEQNDTFRYFKVGGFIIYYIEINIADRPSASKSGKAKQHTISAEQLTKEINRLSD